jgi:glyoxylase-like metal-dependent hydrolase (beta-lactamase superfamily II)
MKHRNECLGIAILIMAAPVFGQVDFSGMWAPLFHEDYRERLPGPEVGDYLGIPLNAAGRLRADSWEAGRLSEVPEYQCRPHGADYSMRGLANMRIDDVRDPSTQRIVAVHTRMSFMEMERTIYLDGRPHPSPNAPHTFAGFSTGEWQDNVLNIYTTHLKESYIKRNGIAASDQRTFTEHWVRHGDYLTVTTVINDPAILEEPLVHSQTWVADPTLQLGAYFCETAAEVPTQPGHVTHHLPGTNPSLHEVADRYHLPYPATRGGPGTMYPEYRKNMVDFSIAAALPAPRASSAAALNNPPPGQIEVLPVQGNVYMLAGAGGNITVQIGKDGVLVVDTGLASFAPAVMAEIRKLSSGPVRYIINTHIHPDHIGGDAPLVALMPRDILRPLGIMMHENTQNRLALQPRANPPVDLPVNGYFTAQTDLYFNGEAVNLFHEPKAHTDGDTVVMFRRSDVVSAGDVFTPDAYPFIDLERGGGIQGEIDALDHILMLTVPAKYQEGGTYVIPGHGRVCDEADLVEFRDMVVIVRDRVRDLMKKGMTLDQVKAARPTLDYDPAYVHKDSFVSADQFVEAIYKSLSRP